MKQEDVKNSDAEVIQKLTNKTNQWLIVISLAVVGVGFIYGLLQEKRLKDKFLKEVSRESSR